MGKTVYVECLKDVLLIDISPIYLSIYLRYLSIIYVSIYAYTSLRIFRLPEENYRLYKSRCFLCSVHCLPPEPRTISGI